MQRNIATLGLGLLLALFVVALALGYWQLLRAPELAAQAQNPRRVEQAARVVRGKIVDRTGQLLAWSETTVDGVVRRYASAAVAPVRNAPAASTPRLSPANTASSSWIVSSATT